MWCVKIIELEMGAKGWKDTKGGIVWYNMLRIVQIESNIDLANLEVETNSNELEYYYIQIWLDFF